MARIEEVKEHIPRSQTKKEKGEQPALIKYYLVAYNVFSVVGWSYVLICTIIHLFALDTWHHSAPYSIFATISKKFASIPYFSTSPLFRPKPTAWIEPYLHPALIPVVRRATTVYARIGYQATIVQSFAILEVLHSLLGWVRSPLTTTLMQVSSRLYVVWGVLPLFPHTQSNPFVASAFLSWSITEVIRYTFYALNLLKIQSSILLYIRYTAFYLLYPTGASSEAFLILNSIPQTVPSGLHEYLRAFLFTIWWPCKWDSIFPLNDVVRWFLVLMSFWVSALCSLYTYDQATTQDPWWSERKGKNDWRKTQVFVITASLTGALLFLNWMWYL